MANIFEYKTADQYLWQGQAQQQLARDKQNISGDMLLERLKNKLLQAKDMELRGDTIQGSFQHCDFFIELPPDKDIDQFVLYIQKDDQEPEEYVVPQMELEKILLSIQDEEEDMIEAPAELPEAEDQEHLRAATCSLVKQMLTSDDNTLTRSLPKHIKRLQEIIGNVSTGKQLLVEERQFLMEMEAGDKNINLDEFGLTSEDRQMLYELIYDLIRQDNEELPDKITKLREYSRNYGRRYTKHTSAPLSPEETILVKKKKNKHKPEEPEEPEEKEKPGKIEESLFGEKMKRLNNILG